MEPHFIAARDRSHGLHRAQVQDFGSGLHRARNQRSIHAQLRTDVAAEHAAVALSARRPSRGVVALPANGLGVGPSIHPCFSATPFEHGGFVVLRTAGDLKRALDSLVVRRRFGFRRFRGGASSTVGSRTLKIGYHSPPSCRQTAEEIHDERAAVKQASIRPRPDKGRSTEALSQTGEVPAHERRRI